MADLIFWDRLTLHQRQALGRIFKDHIEGILSDKYNDGYEKAWSERSEEFKVELVEQIKQRVLTFFREIENE